MPIDSDDSPVKDTAQKTDKLPENAEDTLAVPPPSFRERLRAALRARHIPDYYTPAKPEKPRKPDPKTPPREG